MNPFEAKARAVKVRGLLLALEKLPIFPTADEMSDWGAKTWELLALNAGVTAPSQTTIDAVIAEVTERERSASPADSYDLLPLTSYLDKHPAAFTGYRIAGKWHIRINGVTGVAVRFEEAVANAMNLVFASQGDAMGEGR